MFYFKKLSLMVIVASFFWEAHVRAMDEADSHQYGSARVSERQQFARLDEEKGRLTAEIIPLLAQMKVEIAEAQSWLGETTPRLEANYHAAKRRNPSDRLDLEYSQARFNLTEFSLHCKKARLTALGALTSLLNENGE